MRVFRPLFPVCVLHYVLHYVVATPVSSTGAFPRAGAKQLAGAARIRHAATGELMCINVYGRPCHFSLIKVHSCKQTDPLLHTLIVGAAPFAQQYGTKLTTRVISLPTVLVCSLPAGLYRRSGWRYAAGAAAATVPARFRAPGKSSVDARSGCVVLVV